MKAIDSAYLTKKQTVCLLLMFLIIETNFSQSIIVKKESGIGFTINSTITGDGLGTYYSPSFIYHLNRNQFNLGANFQKPELHFSGINLGHEYLLAGKDLIKEDTCDVEYSCFFDFIELFSFINIAYHSNAKMSKIKAEEETFYNPTMGNEIRNINLKTLEAAVGFGIRINVLDQLKWNNCIGLEVHKNLKPSPNLSMDKQGVGLYLSTSISYYFIKKNITHFYL